MTMASILELGLSWIPLSYGLLFFFPGLDQSCPFLPQAQLQEANPLAIVLPSSRHLAAYGRMLCEEIFTWVLVTSIKGNQSVAWEPSGRIQRIALRN